MGSRTLRTCGGLSQTFDNCCVEQGIGSKYLFVVRAEDMVMDKTTYDLCTPAAPRPVVVLVE